MTVIQNIKELEKKIDYKETSFEKRKMIVDEISNSDFIVDYLDKYNGNLTNSKPLSENDPVFRLLDKLSNYLLNCEEVKESKDNVEYRIYTDENFFRRELNREVKLDGISNNSEDGNKDNVMHFLKNSNLNTKKSKTQKVLKKDFNRKELGEVLQDYDNYLQTATAELKNHKDSKLSRIQLSRIVGGIKNDMIDSKEILLGVFGYNSNPSESTDIDWGMFKYNNKNHVKAMLYLKPGYRADEDLMLLVNDFDEKLKKCSLPKKQREIVRMLREGMSIKNIAEELNVDRSSLYRTIGFIAGRFISVYGKTME